ncbi:MAG: ABC transporter substrate-binding protein, partial [Pseudomonadota bacterium]
MSRHSALSGALAAVVLSFTSGAASAADGIPVGQLVAETGATAPVARVYGQGVADAVAQINAEGGIDGRPIDLVTVDYGYDASEAVRLYERWRETLQPVAIQGWGTADTEALVDRVREDEVVFMSGSASGHLTDPTGRSPWTSEPAPYNFFYGPSYSDGCRALVQYAAEDWERSASAQHASTVRSPASTAMLVSSPSFRKKRAPTTSTAYSGWPSSTRPP